MRIAAVVALVMGLVSISAVAEEANNWAFSADQEGSPAVTAAYQVQCREWAAEAAPGDAKAQEVFIGSCMADMPQLWPVGYEEDES